MIVWISADAAGMPCDQRAEVKEVVGGNVRVTLQGTDQEALVAPSEIVGLELGPTLSIYFDVDMAKRSVSR